MPGLKRLGGDTLIYGFGQVLKKTIGFLLLPFYTRALSPGDYGILDTLATFSYFLAVIFGLGMEGATGRYFFLVPNENERGKLLYTSILIRIISSSLPVFLLLPFSKGISTLLFKTDEYYWVIAITLIAIPIQNISALQEALFQYYRLPWKYVKVSIMRAIIAPISGILLVVILHWGIFGATLASLTSSVIVLIFAFIYFTKGVYISEFSWYWAKKMLKFGYPLIFTGILLWINNVSDRFFLLHYSTLDQIGLYSIANTFSQPILLINLALSMSATVLVMSLFSEEQEDTDKPRTKAFLTRIWHTYLALAGLIAVLISVFSYELVKIVTTPEYIGSILAIPFLLFSHIMYQSMQFTGNGMTLMEKSKPYFWLMLIAADSNVIMNFYFVPKYGFKGASITTLISNFIYFILAYYLSQKYFYVNRSLIKPIIYLGIILGISIFIPSLEINTELHINWAIKILIVFIVSLFPFAFKLISINSIQNLVSVVQKSK